MEKLLSQQAGLRKVNPGDTFASLGPRGNSIILESRLLRPCRLPSVHSMRPPGERSMQFDHMRIPVSDCARSRDWYVGNLDFRLNFENLAAGLVGLKDDRGFTIFLHQTKEPLAGDRCGFTFQVRDVDRSHEELSARGVTFVHAPQKLPWGYGAELDDPDGYRISLWDEVSMREKGR
jgi:catechol 2,3-dioxygenase-like lactoylglutathione lyase family enzyme